MKEKFSPKKSFSNDPDIIFQAHKKEKPEFKIAPHHGSEKALRKILIILLGVMEKSETGIIHDIDPEFLHDFRVGLRKGRSLLSQLKGVLPKEKTKTLTAHLKSLGNKTNKLRDMDVFLIKENQFISMLSKDFQEGIAPLFTDLKSSRKKELKNISLFLKSNEYINIKENIRSILNSSFESKGENSDTPIFTNAKSTIFKRYKKIIGSKIKITINTSDEDIHSLRIECKKLRYLLEIFKALFHEESVNHLIKELKKLQDNLGLFNDLCVQKKFLMEILHSMDTKNKNSIIHAASIGALASCIEARQKSVREEFFSKFEKFNSPGNGKIYEKLFK